MYTSEVVRRILDIGVEQQAYMLSTNDLFMDGCLAFFIHDPYDIPVPKS